MQHNPDHQYLFWVIWDQATSFFFFFINLLALSHFDRIEELGDATEDVNQEQMEEHELERVNLENYSSGRPKRLIRRPVRYLA